jgi:hypothetical protein
MTELEFRQHFIEHTHKTTFAAKFEVASQVFQAFIVHSTDKAACAEAAWDAANIFMAVTREELANHYATLPKPSRPAVHQPS